MNPPAARRAEPAGERGADPPVWVGIDLGTSAIKAVALGPGGESLAWARHGYPTRRPRPGVAEQDPRTWWQGLRAVVDEIRSVVPVSRWRALGLTAMLPTMLVLDRAHRPIGPAVTWQDDRAQPQGIRLRESVGAERVYRRTGQWIDGRYLLPMAAALAERDLEASARGRFLVGAKDYLFDVLTGELCTDPSTAAGYGCYDLARGGWATDLRDPRGPDLDLPDIAESRTAAALAARPAAELGLPVGLPVILGAADSVLGALALGATAPGSCAHLAGSSTVILAPLPEPRFDPAHRFLVTPTESAVAAEMDLLATGAALGWLDGLVGHRKTRDAPSGAASADRDTADPMFLPYLAPGEQGALWDPTLSGALIGLTLAHGPADLHRALTTGIVIESARCLDVLAESADARGDVHAGGAAVSIGMAQDLADATGRRVLLDRRKQSHSAVGAAILAAKATGAETPVPTGGPSVLEPDHRRRDWWAAATERHDAARRAIAAILAPRGARHG